jgi:hypothetical protein
MALSPSKLQSVFGVAREESISQTLAEFLHQGVVVAAAFDHARFLAIGPVGDFAVREMFEELAAGGEDVLARAGEAELAGFESV